MVQDEPVPDAARTAGSGYTATRNASGAQRTTTPPRSKMTSTAAPPIESPGGVGAPPRRIPAGGPDHPAGGVIVEADRGTRSAARRDGPSAWDDGGMGRAPTLLLLPLALSILATACVGSRPIGPPGTASGDRPYRLPFAPGTRRLCVQAAHGLFSHQDDQRHAYDFAMPVGTPVLAARAGRVVAVEEASSGGGASRDHADEGNRVVVLHEDGTRAVYLHLVQHGADVSVGDAVRQGQPIARSGNTGWSAIPHLHVHVEALDRETGRWSTVPMAFEDVRGDGVPQMLMWYASGNAAR